MKMHTKVWARMESVGKPSNTVTLSDVTVSHVILEYAKWISAVYMGSHIRLIMARSESELNAILNGGSAVVSQNILDELESILQQDGLDLDPEDEPALPIAEVE